MKKSTAGILALVLLAIAGLLYWLAPAADTAAEAEAANGARAGSDGSSTHVPPASFTTGTESLPGSLQGTEVDGELEVDAAGRLKIGNGIRRVFDYFLSAIGEEPLESILARIRAYLRHKLPAGAAAEAERLLDSYIAYKRALEAIPQAQPQSGGQMDLDALRRQMQQVQALRRQFFTPEVATAFFGDEDVYDRYTLARLDVMQNRHLSPAQRAAQLAALEDMLPPPMQASIKAINQVQNLDALTADWKQRGGTPAELRQIRENLVGAEAADRLESLDRENADWDRRMGAWLGERAALVANTSVSEQDRERQLEEKRRSRFSAEELTRVEALERMHDRGELPQR
jgi:lipase chaperone LimK